MSLNDYRGLDVPTAKLFLIPTGKLMVPAGSSWFLLVVPAGRLCGSYWIEVDRRLRQQLLRGEDVITLGCSLIPTISSNNVRDSKDGVDSTADLFIKTLSEDRFKYLVR
ncbi:hypothetical protein Tco_0579225 [Tanacetum coccineum]